MALGEAELLRIGDYVKGNLKAWLQELAPAIFTPDPISHSQLLERIVRLDERFEHVDDRFEAMDKRFDDLIHHTDKRFDDLIHHMDKRFEEQVRSVDKRFEEQIRSVDKRFEAMQTTLQEIGKRIGAVQWMVLAGLAAVAVGVTLLVGFLS
jgi:predicted nuclease with TOPRIM domain